MNLFLLERPAAKFVFQLKGKIVAAPGFRLVYWDYISSNNSSFDSL